MKHSHISVFFLFLMLSWFSIGCGDASQSEAGSGNTESSEMAESEAESEEAEMESEEMKAAEEEEFEYDEVDMPLGGARSWESFVPRGYLVLDTAFGDLDRNGSEDILIVCKSETEPEYPGGADEQVRPLILLTQQPNGQIGFAARNDNVVLCQACGGMFDPYSAAVVKNGYFTLEHMGGSSWKWTRFITFKYDEAKKDWFLHKDGGDSWHGSDPENVETSIATKDDFGTVKFSDFDYNESYGSE